MANVNISRTKGMHKLRKTNVFSTEITYEDFVASADVLQLANMPDNVLITRAFSYVVVEEATATTCTGDLGLSGGAELLNDTDLAAAADTVDESSLVPLLLPTGGELTFTVSWTGTTPNLGKIQLVVEYIELDKCSGELVNFVD
jgi:hypothetical protein